MSKVVLLAASLLLVAGIAMAGIINPCNSPVVFNGTEPECYFACPQGDTKRLIDEGWYLSITLQDGSAPPLPIPNVLGSDFWIIGADAPDLLVLCAGSASSAADSATNAAGKTTMSLTQLAVGGQTDHISVVCQGYVLGVGAPPCPPYRFAVSVRSCDFNGDLILNVQDATAFGFAYPPNPYDTDADFNCDGIVNVQDVTAFAFHYGPPGHECL
jgi:hypothetical protein